MSRSKSKVRTACLALSVVLVGGAYGIAPPGAAEAATVTTSSVFAFPSGPLVDGATSTLVRSEAGLTATFHGPKLEPGAAYTFWWVVFNHPENCSPPACNLDDVVPFPGNTAAGTSLLVGSGQVVGSSGRGDFGAKLSMGETSGILFGPGLLDPQGATIHIVLRNHGPALPGMVDEQITTFGGGCSVNNCANEIFAAFEPSADEVATQLAAIESVVTENKNALNAVTALLRRVTLKIGLLP